MKRIVILGSTGSIGVNTLKVVEEFPEQFEVVGLSAGNNKKLLAQQIRRFRPEIVSLRNEKAAADLRKEFSEINIRSGVEGAIKVATWPQADIVVSAIVGAAGLVPTYAAIEAGKDVALANKETLVMAGSLIKRVLKEKGGQLISIDSEHNAICQCLEGQSVAQVNKIILTASGGPFVKYTKEQLAKVTSRQALAHPTWSMGPKISLDSATLMNKGLEVIEAYWLFDMPVNKIEVVIHPQSVIHSLVEMVDGSVLAQLGITDMRLPILYALTYPERLRNKLPKLDLTQLTELSFAKPDMKRFPCLKLAYQALESGGSMPVVLNAANEEAGKAFMEGKIGFSEIPVLIETAMERHQVSELVTIEQALEIDLWACGQVQDLITQTVRN